MITLPNIQKRIKIMIVDDEENDRYLLQGNLKRRNPNLDIVTKSNPISAAFEFKRWIPDIIIADINYNGFQPSALEALIKLAERNQIPIIIHSNADWKTPISARGVIFQKKEEPSKEYFDKLLRQLIKLATTKPKVEIDAEERIRLTRPDWHKSDPKGKLKLLLAMDGITDEEKEVLRLRLELIHAYEDLKLDRLQGLPQKEIDARLDHALKISQHLDELNKQNRVSLNRKILAKRAERLNIQKPRPI